MRRRAVTALCTRPTPADSCSGRSDPTDTRRPRTPPLACRSKSPRGERGSPPEVSPSADGRDPRPQRPSRSERTSRLQRTSRPERTSTARRVEHIHRRARAAARPRRRASGRGLRGGWRNGRGGWSCDDRDERSTPRNGVEQCARPQRPPNARTGAPPEGQLSPGVAIEVAGDAILPGFVALR